MRYRAEIDGIRAIAVVPVILFHAGFTAFSGGYIGVDIFFVLSGFLITSLIAQDLKEGKFSLVMFYERRARRILPALVLVVLACIPFAWAFLVPADMESFSKSVFAVATFSSNILFWRESGYFDAATELKPLLHTWSLAVEEQYYIFFPLLVMALWGKRGKYVPIIVAGILLGSLLLAEIIVDRAPSAAFYLLPTRTWELMVGSLVALLFSFDRSPIPSRAAQQALSILGLSMIAYAVWAFDETTPFPGIHALVPTLGTALLILFARSGTLAYRFLSNRVLVMIGLLSYSAYLWHQPIFAFVRYRTLETPLAVTMIGLSGLTFAFAYLSWRYVERPFRTKGKVQRGGIFALSAVALTSLVSIGLAGYLADGWPNRLSPEKRALIASVLPSPERGRCHNSAANPLDPEDACVFNNPSPQIAVFGDSHTVELAYTLGELTHDLDIGVKQYSKSACSPRFGSARDDECAAWTHAAIEDIVSSSSIEVVIVSYRIASSLYGSHTGHYPNVPNGGSEESRRETWSALLNIIDAFRSGGKRVYFVLQVPEVYRDIGHIIAATEIGLTSERMPGVTRKWWDDRIRYAADRIKDMPEDVEIIDATEEFCDATNCYVTLNGQALYFDDDHMSIAGAMIVAHSLLRKIVDYSMRLD
ncbi:MAG: acyltransferase family protein [Jannaschia sp.]